MVGWSSNYNWTYDELKRNLDNSFKDGQTSVSLNTEHSDSENVQDIIAWCKELGYDAKSECLDERVIVSKK